MSIVTKEIYKMEDELLGVRKFKKKPIVIEAIQLKPENWNEVCSFVDKEYFNRGVWVNPEGKYFDSMQGGTPISDWRMGLLINTLEGTMLSTEGDWIIKGALGEFYSCRRGVFEDTYYEVNNE